MGRRKITIKQIPDVKLRHITFNKRKNGLFKKAAELSVLCNLNLLLVCEDGLGNLIQFSRNKITDIKGFLNQCNFQNTVDLTSEDYPDFARINRKKDKDRDEKDEESESGAEEEEEQPPQQNKTKNTRLFTEMANQHRAPAPENGRKAAVNSNPNYEPRTMSQRGKNNKNLNLTVPENSTTNGESDSVQKKNKNKLNLRLKIPKAEGATDAQTQAQTQAQVQAQIQAQNQAQQHHQAQLQHNEAQYQLAHQALMNDEVTMRAPSSNIDPNGMDRIRRQADYAPLRQMDKSMDYPASSPFAPFMDPLKRLNGVYEQMTSPFKFYGQNARLDTLSNMMKGISPFNFPLSGTPLISKNGMQDDDKLMDAASAMKYMNSRAMMGGPETANSVGGSHKVFTFPQDDSMTPNQMNQLASRNEYNIASQRAMFNQQMPNQVNDYINLPSVMKSDLDFEMNLAPETLSARRFNFSGYFNEFDDNSYNDMRKKHKMS